MWKHDQSNGISHPIAEISLMPMLGVWCELSPTFGRSNPSIPYASLYRGTCQNSIPTLVICSIVHLSFCRNITTYWKHDECNGMCYFGWSEFMPIWVWHAMWMDCIYQRWVPHLAKRWSRQSWHFDHLSWSKFELLCVYDASFNKSLAIT